MPLRSILFSTLLMLVCSTALAAPGVPPDPVVEKCSLLTPKAEEKATPPSVIGKTNNLRRKTGSALVAKGQPIVIYGKLLDERCVPISDARVEAWQGEYRNGKKGEPATGSGFFASSGTATSNNMGLFTFLTVIPPKASSITLHVRITRDNMPVFKTVTYVGDVKAGRPLLTAIPDKSGITSSEYGAPYYITYTLEEDQDTQYRHY